MLITNTSQQTRKVAGDFVKKVRKLDNKKAVVVVLAGDLGSGKTVFAQGFAKALNIKEKVISPTFVILKRFKIYELGFKNLIHIDAYRIDSPKELLELGWKELVGDSKNIILVEWAEKIKKILPREYFLVNFSHKTETRRAIDISLIK